MKLQVRVDVAGQLGVGVPGQLLAGSERDARLAQIGDERVAVGVEVSEQTLLVLGLEEACVGIRNQ